MKHSRREFLKSASLLALSSTLFNTCHKINTDERPNILLILADDMGWSDLGCYGGEIKTPNLDHLAYNGIRFTQFFNTAKCFPSRACLLTGLYAQQCGMDKKPDHLKNSVTLAEVLKSAGYRTLMVGKHHGLDNLYDRGFDRYFGLRDGCCNYFNPGVQREGEGIPTHKTWAFPRKWCINDKVYAPYTPKEKDFYTTDYFTNYALDYLDEYADEDKPFFLYAAYTAPHAPLHAWPKDIEKYRGKYLAGYEKIRKDRYKRQLEMDLIDESFSLSDPAYEEWDTYSEDKKKTEDLEMATYAAMIDSMDQNIGRILKKLKSLGKLENTLILFASDNGGSPGELPADLNGFNQTAREGEIGSLTRWAYVGPSWANVSNTPFRRYKENSHHGGICTPLIAFWPGGIQGKNRITQHTGHFIDFMPTLMEVAKAQYPNEYNGEKILPYSGKSFAPVFKDEEAVPHECIYWEYSKGKAIRKDNWKLVSWDGEWELYDMKTDKTETKNLIHKYPEIAKRLQTLFKIKKEQYNTQA